MSTTDIDINATTNSLTDENIPISPKQQLINTKLDKAGITISKKFQVMAEGLAATKKVEEYIDGVRVINHEPDHIIRHKYLETALRVRDILKDNSVNVGVGVSVKVSDKERELLEAYKHRSTVRVKEIDK